MEFRQTVQTIPATHPIRYTDGLVVMGSCFAYEMGNRLSEYRFNTCNNLFGVVYNPLSMATLLLRTLSKEYFLAEELVSSDGLWHHPLLHGCFSSANPKEVLAAGNGAMEVLRERLIGGGKLMITWGTAWVFEDRRTGQVVANCHKIPAKQFVRRRLSVAEMVETWKLCMERLLAVNPQLQVLITLSPVRHLKDGAHENQLSKASLLLAMEQLMEGNAAMSYFPAYEIMMDELRDYRFYADDFTHPSSLAIEYLFERFCKHWMEEDTREVLQEVIRIQQSRNHRPINPQTPEHQQFIAKLNTQMLDFNRRHPHLAFDWIKDPDTSKQ